MEAGVWYLAALDRLIKLHYSTPAVILVVVASCLFQLILLELPIFAFKISPGKIRVCATGLGTCVLGCERVCVAPRSQSTATGTRSPPMTVESTSLQLELPSRTPPLGAHHDGRGATFSLFSSLAEAVELCLFAESGAETRRWSLQQGDGWFDWSAAARQDDLIEFTDRVCRLREQHPVCLDGIGRSLDLAG